MAPAARVQPVAAGYRFPNGQTYVYEVEWRLFPAGVASLRMDTAAQEQRITGTADATGVVALLYHVHDRFESVFRSQSFCSSSLSKHTEEGLRRVDTQIRFEYARLKAVLDEKNLKSGQSKHEENDIPDCVLDVLSAIYYGGSLPLKNGETHLFPMNDGGKTVDVRLKVEAREEVKTPAGTFRTVRVQPEASSGVLKDRAKVWLWYTDDSSHIPVQMRGRMFWGTLTFRLQRLERQ